MAYLSSVVCALSQLLNATLGGNRDQTFSSRLGEGRALGIGWCRVCATVLDFVVSPFERDHCLMSLLSDTERTYS